jgi:hypothetical protein
VNITIALIVALGAALFTPPATATMLAEKIELRVGESARLGSSDLTVVFEKVDSDGRCPKGVQCVWEGDAVVRLSIGAPKQTRTTVLLHTHPDGQREAESAGFRLRLEALDPYPTIERTTAPDEYRLTLSFTAAK